MIAIVNVSTHDDLIGANEYEVRINQKVITRFTHARSDGLATCLERAAEAVRAEDERRAAEFFAALSRRGARR